MANARRPRHNSEWSQSSGSSGKTTLTDLSSQLSQDSNNGVIDESMEQVDNVPRSGAVNGDSSLDVTDGRASRVVGSSNSTSADSTFKLINSATGKRTIPTVPRSHLTDIPRRTPSSRPKSREFNSGSVFLPLCDEMDNEITIQYSPTRCDFTRSNTQDASLVAHQTRCSPSYPTQGQRQSRRACRRCVTDSVLETQHQSHNTPIHPSHTSPDHLAECNSYPLPMYQADQEYRCPLLGNCQGQDIPAPAYARSMSVTSLPEHHLNSVRPHRLRTPEPYHVRAGPLAFPRVPAHRLHSSCDLLDNDVRNDVRNPLQRDPTSIKSGDGSEYAEVGMHRRAAADRNAHMNGDCENIQNNLRFYKRYFFVLIIFNVLLLLMNSAGLPLVYVTTRLQEREPFCVECYLLKSVGAFTDRKDSERCCVDSNEDVLSQILFHLADVGPMTGRAQQPIPEGYTLSGQVPTAVALQVSADEHTTYPVGTYRVEWKSGREVGIMMEVEPKNNKFIIKKSGYYFVFGRVAYRMDAGATKDNNTPFTATHTIKKSDGRGNDPIIASAEQRCFVSNQVTRHTSNIQFLHHFKVGDSIYLTIDNGKYFHAKDTSLGMFRLPGS